jgi:hypothetical protein
MSTDGPHDVGLVEIRERQLAAPDFGSTRRMLATMFQTAAIERSV